MLESCDSSYDFPLLLIKKEPSAFFTTSKDTITNYFIN